MYVDQLNMETLKLILQKAYMLNARMKHLEFKVMNVNPGYVFKYLPGQFISILFNKNSNIIRRNFSIASEQNNDNILEIAVTYVIGGFGSTLLHNMEVGEVIDAVGPFGTFLLKPEEFIGIKRYILVATGTGVTPFRAMLGNIRKYIQMYNLEFILLLGVRSKEELLYAKDFVNFAEQYSNFKFYPSYSREHNEIPEMNNNNNNSSSINCYNKNHEYCSREHENGQNHQFNNRLICDSYDNFNFGHIYKGYVQQQLDKLNINFMYDAFYLCGNPNMIDEALIILKQLFVPTKHIKREKYISVNSIK